jgi:hypothetical protein
VGDAHVLRRAARPGRSGSDPAGGPGE